jgi:hypothetical protein
MQLVDYIVIFVILDSVYDFFHIAGCEIKFLDKLLDAKTVTVLVTDEDSGEKTEYNLNKNQIEQFQEES